MRRRRHAQVQKLADYPRVASSVRSASVISLVASSLRQRHHDAQLRRICLLRAKQITKKKPQRQMLRLLLLQHMLVTRKPQRGGSRPGKSANRDRNHEDGHKQLVNVLQLALFLGIHSSAAASECHGDCSCSMAVLAGPDATGKPGLSSLQTAHQHALSTRTNKHPEYRQPTAADIARHAGGDRVVQRRGDL